MEGLRRMVIRVMGRQKFVFKYGSRLIDLFTTTHSEGFGTYLELQKIRNRKRRGEAPVPVSLSNLQHPFYIRPGWYDAFEVISTVVREEYAHQLPVKEPQWMIDAGAWIGDTAAYFLSRFPNLRVIALEPNEENYQVAKKNLEPYGDRVVLLKKCLYSEDSTVRVAGQGLRASVQNHGEQVETVSIPTLMEEYSIPRVDILKMDIEGSEEIIFTSDPENWLPAVDFLAIETHGPKIRNKVCSALQENKFEVEPYRKILYCKPTSAPGVN